MKIRTFITTKKRRGWIRAIVTPAITFNWEYLRPINTNQYEIALVLFIIRVSFIWRKVQNNIKPEYKKGE
jgi:hypothetical protein